MPLTRCAAQGVVLAASMMLLMVLPFNSSVRPALAAELAGLAASVDLVRQAACPSPRPPMQLQTQPLGDGRLQVTLRAGTGALQAIRFGAIQNARVEVPGVGQTYASNSEVKPPSGATSFTFVIVSDAAVQAGQTPPPVTVPLTAFDGCGVSQPWSTFVGGGTATLQSTASIADTQVTEGDAGNTVLTFTVKLSVPSSRAISVSYATADGSARAGTDYVAASGTVTFAPGETSKTITVQVRGNLTAEPDKTFTISLSNPVNAALGQAQATARILNDDTEPGASGDVYTANAGQILTVGEGAGPPPGLLVNDRAGSQAIQITSFGGLSAPGDVTTHPAGTTANLGNGGTLTVNANGAFSFLAPSGFSGAYSFRYRAASSAGTSEATVIITVVGGLTITTTGGPTAFVEGGGPVVVDAGATVTSGGNSNLSQVTATIQGLADAGLETLAANTAGTAITAAYSAPTLTLSGNDTPAHYQQVLRGITYANGSPAPTPSPRTIQFVGTANGQTSAPATKVISVGSTDNAPVAVADARTVAEDSGAIAINVLANDTDVDGGPKSVASATQPANGTVVITGGGTGLTYQPNADYCNTPPGTTLDTFTYTLAPGGSMATVSVSATCIDDDPTAVADSTTVAEDSGATAIDVLANDADVDSGLKTITANTNGSNGAVVTITGGGTGLTYQPAANFCGTDTFSYTLNGGPSAAQTATVSVTVTCAQDKPTRAAITATAQANVPLLIPALASIVDPDDGMNGCTPTYQIVSLSAISPAGGDLSIDTSVTPNVLVFDPPVGTTGTSTFSYAIEDSGCPGPVVTSDPVTVTVNVVGTDGTISGPLLWFVNNNAGACPAEPCDGRLSHPFKTLADVDEANGDPSPTAPKDNHVVFLYESATDYLGPLKLRNGQKLIGQDASKSLAALVNLTVDPAWAALPTTDVAGGTVTVGSNGSGTSLTLGSGNSLRGFTLGSPTNTIALAGNNFGTLTFAAGTGADQADVTVNALGPALYLIDGTVNGALVSTTSTTLTNSGVTLTDVAGTFDMGGGALTGGPGPGLFVHSSATPSTSTATISYSGTITAGTSSAVLIQNRPAGAGPITLSGAITGVAGQPAVNVTGVGGGPYTFSGKVTAPSASGFGVLVQKNLPDAQVAFSGGLDIETTTGIGFVATDGGTVTVTGTGNTIDSVSASALQVSGVTIGAAGLTFERISAGNNTAAEEPTVGISLINTGTLGGLTVTGNGTADSGGTIQRTRGPGIQATNTSNLSITNMRIDTPGDTGILATDGGGIWTVANSTITGYGPPGGIRVKNSSTHLTKLTVTGTAFSNNTGNGLSVEINPAGAASMDVSIEGGSTFSNLTQGAIRVYPDEDASGTIKMTVKDSSFTNIQSIRRNSVIDLWMLRSRAILTTNIEGNTFDTVTVTAPTAMISVLYRTQAVATLNTTIKGNTFTHLTDGYAIYSTAYSNSVGTFRLLIDGNDFDSFGTNDSVPIYVLWEGATAPDLTVQKNKIGQNGPLWPANGNASPIYIGATASGRVHLDNNSVTANMNGTVPIVSIGAVLGATLDTTVTNNSLSGSGTSAEGVIISAQHPSGTINATITGNDTHTKTIHLIEDGSGVFNLTGGVADLPLTNAAAGFPTAGTITTVSTVPALPALPPLP